MFRFVDHLQALDPVATIEDLKDSFGGDIHVRLGVDAAWQSQSNQFQLGVVMIAGLLVASGGDDASLH